MLAGTALFANLSFSTSAQREQTELSRGPDEESLQHPVVMQAVQATRKWQQFAVNSTGWAQIIQIWLTVLTAYILSR